MTVVDASIAIKWFVREDLHAEADKLLEGSDDLYAPDIILSEIANVAWKKAVRKEITMRQASRIAAAMKRGVPILFPSSALVDRALQIAFSLNHSVYDCFYVACAEFVGSILITADQKLCRIARGTPFEGIIQHLER